MVEEKKSIIALVLNILLGLFAFIAFELEPMAFGLVIGTAAALLFCEFKRYSFFICLIMQLVVVLLLAEGLNLWLVYAIFAISLPIVEVIFKVAAKGWYLIGSYLTAVIIPPIFIGLFRLFEVVVCQ